MNLIRVGYSLVKRQYEYLTVALQTNPENFASNKFLQI